DQKIFSLYNRIISLSDNRNDAAIGYLGYGLCKLWSSDVVGAIENFYQINPKTFKYRSYSIATCFRIIKKFDVAEKFYLKEIADSGYAEGSYRALADMYLKSNNQKKAIALIYNKNAEQHLSRNKVKNLAYLDGNVSLFFVALFQLIYERINIIGLIAAFLITITYLLFLRRIDIYKRKKWIFLLLVFFLGEIISFGSDYLSSIIYYDLGFSRNGKEIHDFFYSVFATGAVEEIIKIFPLLILLIFSKSVSQPFHYILIASVSALGFAFVENLLYFNTDSINIIHGRALISVLGHMFYSSVIAYGLILAKFRGKINSVIAFFIFYILASISHGLYNWLLDFGYSYLFVLYYLFIIRIWVAFINNSLNNSPHFDYKILFPAKKIQYFLVMSLTGILAFEYIALGYIYGSETANNTIQSTTSTGSIVIFFLSTRLSRFDLMKKQWKVINLKINPFVFTAPLNYVGTEIRFITYKRKVLQGGFPEQTNNGIIINRITVENDAIWKFKKRKKENNWFIVELNSPFVYENKMHNKVLIKFQGKDPGLIEGDEALAKLMIVENKDLLLKEKINRTEIQFVETIVVDNRV
ncbi:MAG: PrsW family intramembrane metalloprotease, partial [Bacteroidales bacterium]|nr:PrsW family intramembrane metalloprotease [Bacteroidales bacterium]